MSASQREKGARGERELARLLRDRLGTSIERNLEQSRDGGADLIADGPLAGLVIEVKRKERLDLQRSWNQACQQARDQDGWPCLAYRLDRKPWLFVLPLGCLHIIRPAPSWEYRFTVDIEAFVELARVRTWRK
jgi:Holliday junction resolvase